MVRTLRTPLTVAAAVLAVVLVVDVAQPGSVSPVVGVDREAVRPGALPPRCAPAWVAAWNASPVAAPGRAVAARPEVGGRSLRMVLRPGVAGAEIRLVLSNRYGAEPLELRSVSVGPAGGGPALTAEPVPVSFGGQPVALVPPRGVLRSDPVPLPVSPAGRLAVNMFLPGRPAVVSEHPYAMRTSYLSEPGDAAGSVDGSAFRHPIDSWLVLTGVDVRTPRATHAVLVMGDSITDGVGSSRDAGRRLTDDLGERLAALGGSRRMAVLNAGIAGNRLLADLPSQVGESALGRLGWEVAGRPGVTDVILHSGTNDVAAGEGARDVIDGMARFAGRAHQAGLRVFLTTITPATSGSHGSPGAVAARHEVNRWVRTEGRASADGVFDFAAAVTAASPPNGLALGFDAGDGLHLSDAGYRALAGAVDPAALSGSRCLA